MNNFLGIIILNETDKAKKLYQNFKDQYADSLIEAGGKTNRYLFKVDEKKSQRNLTQVCISPSKEIVICGYLRIDNKKDLASVLGIDSSEKDEEFLYKAYIKWGSKLSNKIIGSFAFLIYDSKLEKFICFRDHMGMKPFYYYKNKDVFIFSSRIKLITEITDITKKINKERVIDYLMFVHPKDGQTFYSEVHKLPRCHILEYKSNEFLLKRYFEFNINIESKLKSSKEYIEKFNYILHEVVDSHINSDNENVGIAYSGGLDSTSLLKIADSLINTKSIFSKSAIFKNLNKSEKKLVDEKYFMDLGLKNNKNVNHKYLYFEDDGPIKNINDVLDIFDEPISAINFYIFKKIALSLKEQNIKILLDGIDGDSVVSHGYEKFDYLAHKYEIRKLYGESVSYANFTKIEKPSFFKIIKRYFILNKLPERIKWMLFNKTQLHPYWALKILDKTDLHVKKISLRKSLINHYGMSPLKKSSNPKEDHHQKISLGSWENSLEDLDSILTYYGIDHRMPFFDRRLMEFCLSVPVSLKFKNGVNRYIFREAMQKIIPEKIRLRSSKSDLSPPLLKEIISIGKDKLIDIILNKNSPLTGLIDKEELEKFIKNTINNNSYKNAYFLIFQLVSLSRWMEKENLNW